MHSSWWILSLSNHLYVSDTSLVDWWKEVFLLFSIRWCWITVFYLSCTSLAFQIMGWWKMAYVPWVWRGALSCGPVAWLPRDQPCRGTLCDGIPFPWNPSTVLHSQAPSEVRPQCVGVGWPGRIWPPPLLLSPPNSGRPADLHMFSTLPPPLLYSTNPDPGISCSGFPLFREKCFSSTSFSICR